MSQDNWSQEAVNAANQAAENFELDASDVTADDLTDGHLFVDKEGFYHFEISNVTAKLGQFDKDGEPNQPHLSVSCTVLETVPNQSPAGFVLVHKVNLAGKPGEEFKKWQQQAAFRWLTSIGVLNTQNGQVIDPATGTTKIDVKTLPERMKGRQFIGKVVASESGDKTYYQFHFGGGCFQCYDEKVSHVPKNAEALQAIGITSRPAAPPQQQQPVQQAPQQAPQQQPLNL